MDDIVIEGAREHNLKGISLRLPRENFIVVTGPSGSGKSSLAFDTIYAEGHRRYVESLSTYARQFLERVDKPDVDAIEGISPAIAIAQYNPVKHSRSTVGTASEIYDYLRLLYAKAGDIHCPACGNPVRPSTVDSSVNVVLGECEGERGFVLFPAVLPPESELDDFLKGLMAQGFIRVMVNGEVHDVSPGLADLLREKAALPEIPPAKEKKAARKGRPPKQKKKAVPKKITEAFHLRVVVDRLIFSAETRARLGESLETAFREGGDVAEVQVVDGPLFRFSRRLECCGQSFQGPIPLTFSFNNPQGACHACGGFGNMLVLDEDLIVPDPDRSLAQGAIAPWTRPRYRSHFGRQLQEAAKHEGLDIHKPWKLLPESQKEMVLNGTDRLLGVHPHFDRLRRKKYKVWVRVFIRRFQSLRECTSCGGSRLRPEAHWVKLGGKSIADICAMPVDNLLEWLEKIPLRPDQEARARDILRQVRDRLDFLHHVGLDYLALDRETRTLSGGESQRINLANQLGAHLTGTLYILDEPTIGLHPRDNAKLIKILKDLVERGNTLIVVEHDREVIEEADYVVDLGPGAGERGGEVIYAGPRKALLACEESVTAKYLRGARRVIPRRPRARPARDGRMLSLIGASENNLKNVDLHIPIGAFSAITGVSGSGKSTLVHDTLYPALARIFHGGTDHVGKFQQIHGFEHIEDVVLLDQSPIGKSPRSNPVTYLKAYDVIRRLFADTTGARTLGYGPGHFSFNSQGGRCESCSGTGFQKVEMHFMADLFIRCPDCEGKRFKPQAMGVKYRGLNIHEVLNLTVEEAIMFFENSQTIVKKLHVLRDVGLGYMRIGQPVTTLSGGEAQRLKIASHLVAKPPRDVLYLLDEPTTGLHFQDVERLLEVLLRLVALGNTVVVIEHNLDVIRCADWIIDLGPEGGEAGGRIIAEGPPEMVSRSKLSYTGIHLKSYLHKNKAG